MPEVKKPEEKSSIIDDILERLPASFVSVILLFVALGNFNDSFEVMNRFYEFGRSLFSNQVFYERIDNVKVGLNANYLDSALGEPQVIKRITQLADENEPGDIDKELDVNYYFEDDFFLVVFVYRGQIEGFYVSSFTESFAPNISLDSSQDLELWSVPFDNVISSIDDLYYDFSRNNTFYIEYAETMVTGLSMNVYLGWTNVGNQTINQDLYTDLEQIVELDLLQDESLLDQIMIFRATYAPNLYGYGNVRFDSITESLLTNSELLFYAGIG